MVAFFNEHTGISYPYEKLDQIIIDDFMWGGMENITLIHQSSGTMHTDRARPDHTSDGLVAHEIAPSGMAICSLPETGPMPGLTKVLLRS